MIYIFIKMIIGLTGGIGVGKSFVAKRFKNLGCAVFNADSVVHQLYKSNESVINYVKENFFNGIKNGEINKDVLSEHFLLHDANWTKFQSFIHFAVKNELEIFIAQQKKINKKFLVLDIPLLMETEFRFYCEVIIFIHAEAKIQTIRLNKRNVDKKKLDLMFDIQIPVTKKKQMSNLIIDNSKNEEWNVLFQIKNIMKLLNFNQLTSSHNSPSQNRL